jgi:hypothetical protein
VVIGPLEFVTSPSHDDWIGVLIALGGSAQVAAGIVAFRRNQRLDRQEDEAARTGGR